MAVAGIPFVHRGAPGVEVPVAIVPDWGGGRVECEPIVVSHSVGDTSVDRFRLIARTPPPTGDFFLDERGGVAVRFPGYAPVGIGPQLLRTVAAGYAYELVYESPRESSWLAREWHRTLTMLALPARRRGVLAHAAGFVFAPAVGILCPGVSGTGKSTIAATLRATVTCPNRPPVASPSTIEFVDL